MMQAASPYKSRSLWHMVSRNAVAYPALEGEVSADVAIIGAGFLGLSAALHAAEAGLSVVVVEAETIAWGASGRNAGFVVPNFARKDPDAIIAELGAVAGERLVMFAAKSADLVFGLIKRHRIDCDGRQAGWVHPMHSPEALERVKRVIGQLAARDRPVELLDRDQVRELCGIDGYLGGLLDRSGGTVNPVAYARGLASAACGAGAGLFEHSPVCGMARRAGRWRVETGRGAVTARKVLLATNAYGGTLNRQLARNYIPLKIFQIATAPLPEVVRRRFLPHGHCMSDSRRNLFTFRFDAANRLISGGMHILDAGSGSRVPRAIHRRLARNLEIDLPPIEFAWSGLAAVTTDFLPRLVEVGPSLLAAFACNGRGIAMTTMMGKALAKWAMGTTPNGLPVPLQPVQAIPFHSLAKYAPNALLPLSIARDRLESPLR
ncbi:FAD-binding oxidoreductase [Mesorhizobium sp. M0659]|uniref:NAD(P)/FAD-dependent oxidoreductase n=1 Tax=Mesorhizobium sp. M0659 TaxID=2956980 RepID=UPI0033391699